MTRKETAAEITASVAKYYTKRRYCVSTEIGLRSRREGMLRADILALNMKREIIIIEVKSSVADFRADSKYEFYLDYCNKMYIACMPDVALKIKDSVNKQVGLMVMEPRPRIIKHARYQDLDDDLRLQILTRLVFRKSDFNRYKKRKNS